MIFRQFFAFLPAIYLLALAHTPASAGFYSPGYTINSTANLLNAADTSVEDLRTAINNTKSNIKNSP